MGGPLRGPAGTVVRRGADQRVPERDPPVLDDDDAAGRRVVEGAGSGPERVERRGDPVHLAVGVGGDHDEGVAEVGIEAFEDELGHPLATVSDRQRVRQHGPTGPLGRLQQVGRLHQDERVAAPGGEQAALGPRRC